MIMSGTLKSGTVGDYDKGAKYGCLRCGEFLPSHEHQEAHNASKHSQPQGGGTAYRAVDKTKV
jgi:hypothetical protein